MSNHRSFMPHNGAIIKGVQWTRQFGRQPAINSIGGILSDAICAAGLPQFREATDIVREKVDQAKAVQAERHSSALNLIGA